MARFKGDNDLDSTIDLSTERSNYYRFAFPENNGMGPQMIRDYGLLEWTKFGRMDLAGDAVFANSKTMKSLSVTEGLVNTIVAQNFVTDAFAAMRQHMAKACSFRIIKKQHPYIVPLNPVRAYQPPLSLYEDYIAQIFASYNQEFLSNDSYRYKIYNYGDYLRYLPDFMKELGSHSPMTMTGWQRSKNSSIFTSGLAIDIAGLTFSEDAPKDELFLSTEEFSYYLKLANFYGFAIHKNAPFVLVADVDSPAMEKYLSLNHYASAREMLGRNFVKTSQYDIEKLKAVILQNYNIYVTLNPYSKRLDVCESGKTKYLIKDRSSTNIQRVNAKYSADLFLNLYIDIRNTEEENPFKSSDIARIKQKSAFFRKHLGANNALAYINEQYRSLYASKRGTVYDFLKKQKERRNNT